MGLLVVPATPPFERMTMGGISQRVGRKLLAWGLAGLGRQLVAVHRSTNLAMSAGKLKMGGRSLELRAPY
jgi:hypothetical protein